MAGLMLMACRSSEPTPTPVPLADFLAQASTLVAEKRYHKAVERLEAAAEAHSASPVPFIQIGQIHLRQQQTALAEDAFNRALARDLANPIAIMGLAETQLRQGSTLRALSLWQEVVTLDPELPGVFTGLGRVHLARLEFDAAKAAFAEQLARQPEAEAAWYLAAMTAATDIEAARAYLTEMPANLSDDLVARRDYLAAVLDSAGDGPQSEVDQAVGVAMVQIEMWPLAIYSLQIANQAENRPDAEKAETLAFLGHALAQQGRPALETFRRAEALDPNSALPAYFQGIYLRQQNALGVAEDYLKRAAALDAKNPAVYIELARVKRDQGNLAAAEDYYMTAVETAPDDFSIQILQAKFYAGRSYRLEEAGIPLAEALIEADRDNAEAYDLLGWMQFLTGAVDNAETNLRRAVELDPDLISARYHLARLLETQGQLAEARQAYEVVTERDISGAYRGPAWEGVYRIEGAEESEN